MIKEDLVGVSRIVELYCAQSARVPPQSHTHRNNHPKTPPPPLTSISCYTNTA
jgi:hypothetical protein